MNLIGKFKSIVYCNFLYHEGFQFKEDGFDVMVCENCRKSFKYKSDISLTAMLYNMGRNNSDIDSSISSSTNYIEDKDNGLLMYYLDKTSGMVDNPKKLMPEDFQLIKICHPELEEYTKLWRVF